MSMVRVRFAPSPTGFMHLGNVRSALVNYLYACQKRGTFVLRIEDTDQTRNFDERGTGIIKDLAWLKLNYTEGPGVGGPHIPYYQSERTALYQENLDTLITQKLVYRCFCTTDALDKKKQRQIALKQAPRYDRTCLALKQDAIEMLLDQKTPFIWRFRLPDTTISITDLARGTITYDLKNFSDFAITRQDGSFTFIFANFVDDMLMAISHIFRGEDHLSNTANQAALYQAFQAKIPIFWHLPILCTVEGKKLSKRDFGFSLNDLRDAGYLPEAINNYLAIIGGSFEQEIMSMSELITAFKGENIHATGQIKYDIEKLNWVNHKWITKIDIIDLAQRCKVLLTATYPSITNFSDTALAELLKPIQSELTTLNDSIPALAFYFNKPAVPESLLIAYHHSEYTVFFKKIITENSHLLATPEIFMATVGTQAKEEKLGAKNVYALMRIALTGSPQGPAIKDLILMLGAKESLERFCIIED